VSTNAAEEIEIIKEEDETEQQELQLEVPAEQGDEPVLAEDGAKEEELQQYSKKVQQRISKITQKYRDEEAQRQAAVEYAENVKRENDELKARLNKVDTAYTTEAETRITSQIEQAKVAYQQAYDAGDANAMFESQKILSKLAMDQARVEQAKVEAETAAMRREQEVEQPVQQPVQQQQAQPDPRAEEWAQNNEWFGTDQPMTYAAFGIHRQLIEDEGFDPQSEEYYTEIDNRIRREFPHKFQETPKSSGPRVASAESSASKAPSGKGRRTVKLTPSQIAIAKRLNVPLEEYAKYVKD